MAAAGLVGLALGLTLGMLGDREPESRSESEAVRPSARRASARVAGHRVDTSARAGDESVASRVGLTSSVASDAGQGTGVEHAGARSLTGRLFRRAAAERGAPSAGGSIEAVANNLGDYVAGMAQVIEVLPFEQRRAIVESLREELCGAYSPERGIVGARLMRRARSIADADALECVLAAEVQEGPVLYAALDTWHAADLAPRPAWERWRDVAQARAQQSERGRGPRSDSASRAETEPDRERRREP